MRVKGLEPPRRETPDPKSGASANSATPAHIYHFLATLHMPLTTEFILQDICFFVNRVYTIFFDIFSSSYFPVFPQNLLFLYYYKCTFIYIFDILKLTLP